MLFNIYCDESCHLEHDGINVMVWDQYGVHSQS